MSLHKKFSLIFCLLLFLNLIGAHSSSAAARNSHLDKYKFLAYIIYDDIESDVKIIYTEERFGGIVSVAHRQKVNVRLLLSPGTYITSTDYTYNAYKFELQSIVTEHSSDFYFDLQEGKHYYFLVRIDRDGTPNLTPVDELKAREMLKRFKSVTQEQAIQSY